VTNRTSNIQECLSLDPDTPDTCWRG